MKHGWSPLKLAPCVAALGLALLPASMPRAQTIIVADGLPPALFASPEDGGARRWQVNASDAVPLREGAANDARVVARLAERDVLSNAGCTMADGERWCSVRPIRGGGRGYVLAKHLMVAVGPDGIVPVGVDDSRQRAEKRDFDATGKAPCAQEQGEALGTCDAAVARGTGGDATVVVTFANGFARKLYFVHGIFVAASATMSGAGRDTDWRREGELHLIRADDQRFELADSFVFGDRP
ncbi:MAG: hypothetical protein AAF160_00030 [Pseudomonadota bacterium]